MDHLVEDEHAIARLDDLQVRVIRRRKHRRSGRADETPLDRRPIFRTVSRMRLPRLSARIRASPGLGRERGNSPILRVDNQRRAPSRNHLSNFLPDFAQLARGRDLEIIEALAPSSNDVSFVLDCFLLGENLLVGKPLRALEGRHRIVCPDALQVGMAVRCARKRAGLRASDRSRERKNDSGERYAHGSLRAVNCGLRIADCGLIADCWIADSINPK